MVKANKQNDSCPVVNLPAEPETAEGVDLLKRKRGRPRIHPLPDPNAPPKRRGRPRCNNSKTPTVADMKSFRRKWSMINMMLHSRDGYTIDEMAEKFSVTPRTIRRDLRIIEDIFGEIGINRVRWGLRRYYIEQLPFKGRAGAITRDELISICIACKIMMPLAKTSIGKAIVSGAGKIRNCFSKDSVVYADRALSFFQPFRQQPLSAEDAENLDILLDAMSENNGVTIRYFSARDQREKIFDVLPYHFIYDKGFVYISGYSYGDQSHRIWKLNRILDIKPNNIKFQLPKNYDVQERSEAAITSFLPNESPVLVRVRFTAKAALIVKDQELSVVQRHRKLKNGYYEVEMEVDPNPSFINWILSFGRGAEVVSPIEVRNLVFDEMKKLAEIYQQ